MAENSRSASSLIELKAELYKKQEEFQKQKLESQNSGFIKGKSFSVSKKPSVWSRKNIGVLQRAQRDVEDKQEEENIYEKSKKSLEQKARLYDKITSETDIPEEDGSGLYLVDFQKKAIDNVFERRERERREEEERQRRDEEEEKRQLLEPVAPPLSAEEEWVDYTDSLGRSRRCLRKDLPDLMKQDQRLQGSRTSDSRSKTLMSDDMRREEERKRWEKAELETMEAEKAGPVHYSDVRYNETRTHGVGFFEFDKDETKRQEQMTELNQLRQQTIDEKSKRDRIKEKRKAMMEARLAKVKQRKKLKGGYMENEENEDKNEGEETEEIGPRMPEKADANMPVKTEKETESLKIEDTRKSTPVREWDKGKERLFAMSGEQWLKERREERVNEFAPPSAYNEQSNSVFLKSQSKPALGRNTIFSKLRQIKEETMKIENTVQENVLVKQGARDGETSVCGSEGYPATNSTVADTELHQQQTGSQTQQFSRDIFQQSSVNQTQSFNSEVPPQSFPAFIPQFDPSQPPPSFLAPPSALVPPTVQNQGFPPTLPTFPQAPPPVAALSNQQVQQLAQAPPPPPSYPPQPAVPNVSSLSAYPHDVGTSSEGQGQSGFNTVNYSTIQHINMSQPQTIGKPAISVNNQYSAVASVAGNVPKVPKESIIDRRLMQNNDSD